MLSQLEQEHRLTALEEKIRIQSETRLDHEGRIRHLERWAWTAIGALAAIEILPTILKFLEIIK